MTTAGDGNKPTAFFVAPDSSPRSAGQEPGPSLAGDVLKGAYRVEAKLGEGGMGVVYRGTQLSLGRAVAIKTLSLASRLAEETVQRFFREARILSQLNHPNIVSIIDFGTTGTEATPFMVMELLSGKPLDGHVTAQHRLSLREVFGLMTQMCAGIAAAHQANIIHRDLKPSNVFVTVVAGSAEPVVKLLDFGLAKPALAMPDSGIALTEVGVGVGTCGFTAPEQLEGFAEPDARADVYGLGALLYFALTGRPPYQAQTVQAVVARQMTRPPDPIDFPALGLSGAEAIEPILLKAMSISPHDRYQSVAEFKGALEAILTAILSCAERRAAEARIGGTQTGTGAVSSTAYPHGGATPLPPTTPSATAVSPFTIPASGPTPTSAHPATPATLATPRRRSTAILWTAGLLGLGGLAVAAWLIFGGKGDDDGNKTPPPPILKATAPGVTPTTITLGISAPFSGPAKELGHGMKTGIETYFDYLNETAGGIHGRTLKLLALDDGYEPKRVSETMKEMLTTRPVFAFIGNVGTPTAEVAVPLAKEHKRIFFGAYTGAGLLREDPPDRYVFNYRASYAEETAAIIHYLLRVRKVKPDEIAVFAQQDGYGEAGFSGVAKALRKVDADAKQIVRVGYERNSMELDAAVNGVLKHKNRIKAIVMVPTYRQAAAFIKRVKDGGMNPIFTSVSFVGSDALGESLKELGPKYAEGVIVTQVVPFHGSGASGVLEYRERLSKYSSSERPGFVSLEGYIAAKVFCTALEKAGPELTTEKLVETLETIHTLDFGIGAPITFGPSEHQGSHRVWGTVLNAKVEYENLDIE